MLGEWAGLACERMIRHHSRSRLPLIVPGHGPEGGKWAKVEAKCSISPIQCSAQGCCVGCTVYMAEAWERRAVQGFGTAKNHSVNIYAVLLLSQETTTTSLHATMENAGLCGSYFLGIMQ